MTPDPLPPHLERIGCQLTAAADDLHARNRRRSPRRRPALILASAGVLATAGVAAAAVLPGLVQTNQHQLYSPNSQGVEQPIDNCQRSANASLYVCTSPVGTNVQAKNASGQYVAPGDCTWSGQTETCQQPFRFTLDLSNPQRPKLVGDSTASTTR